MSHLLLILALASAAPQSSLPHEVEAFVADRDACDHFREEPTDGDLPDQVDRRKFVQDSLEIYCAGTDRRLAALKRRYSSNPRVMAVLGRYEPTIEERGCGP